MERVKQSNPIFTFFFSKIKIKKIYLSFSLFFFICIIALTCSEYILTICLFLFFWFHIKILKKVKKVNFTKKQIQKTC
jgi:hypothetical protein